MSAKPVQLDVYRTAIPMRSFEHAAAARRTAEAVVVRARFSDGREGWGETLPRPYVTGETMETVAADLEAVIWPACRQLDFAAGPAATAGIPTGAPDGRCLNAASCALELACMDWLLARPPAGPAQAPAARWARPARIAARVSGVLGSADPARTARRLRLMRWFGLRDFKLKLGFGGEVDAENLRIVHERLGRALAAGKGTLRVDVNGGWDADQTVAEADRLRPLGVCAIEQPVFGTATELAALARRCALPLIADESLRTTDDARELLAEPDRVWWNVRISKNGGLVRAAELADLAASHGVTLVVGCMVGESGLLSAAQRRLLQRIESPRFVEGNYGRLLLADDLTRPSPRIGYGGRLTPLRAAGLGVTVESRKIGRYGRRIATLGG
jgi:L-alanine-DL-glutamate epimerase-like enolase superfamily enzyme